MIKVCEDGIFELYFGGRYYGCVRVENLIPHQEGRGNFHIDIIRFTHNILNRMKRDEASLMSYIRDAGYNELISFVDIHTVKGGSIKLWSKFVKLFEFEEPKLFTRKIL
jgi:hypothetical protein